VVSHAFARAEFRSPSFGSRRFCFYSNLLSETHGRFIVQGGLFTSRFRRAIKSLSFNPRLSLLLSTQTLAKEIDSLIRVTRRVLKVQVSCHESGRFRVEGLAPGLHAPAARPALFDSTEQKRRGERTRAGCRPDCVSAPISLQKSFLGDEARFITALGLPLPPTSPDPLPPRVEKPPLSAWSNEPCAGFGS